MECLLSLSVVAFRSNLIRQCHKEFEQAIASICKGEFVRLLSKSHALKVTCLDKCKHRINKKVYSFDGMYAFPMSLLNPLVSCTFS